MVKYNGSQLGLEIIPNSQKEILNTMRKENPKNKTKYLWS